MKAYTLIHHYVCGIQTGIQAAHSLVELMVNCGDDLAVVEWSTDHKAVCWLDCWDMEGAWDLVSDVFPSARFEEPAMGDLCTAVSFVVTDTQIEIMKVLRGNYSCVSVLDMIEVYDEDDEQVGCEISEREFEALLVVSRMNTKRV